MTRLLFAARRPCHPLFLGGAELSVHELAQALSQQGAEVRVIGDGGSLLSQLPEALAALDAPVHWEWEGQGGLPLRRRLFVSFNPCYRAGMTLLSDFELFVDEEMQRFQPDVVLTQLDGALDVMRVAEAHAVPVVHVLRDTFNPTNLFPFYRCEGFVPAPRLVLANSAYTAGWAREIIGREIGVVHPCLPPLQPLKSEDDPGGSRVLVINPSDYKGGKVMLEVAGALPELHFIVAPGWGRVAGGSWRRLPNVTVLDAPIRCRRQLFGMADLVVVASQRPESLPRVILEAQAFGLPVIASKHTGLVEAAGDGAWLVEDYRRPQAWFEPLRALAGQPPLVRALRAAGRRNTTRFSAPLIAKRFLALLQDVFKEGVGCERRSYVPFDHA